MSSVNFEQSLLMRIQQESGYELKQACLRPVRGGQTHQAYRLQTSSDSIFIKINSRINKTILQSEYQSLCLLAETSVAAMYPKPLFIIEFDELVVMGLPFWSMLEIDNTNAKNSAEGLIKHHQTTASRFGWSVNNFIGSTKQSNDFNDSWLDFYRQQRLLPQLRWASNKGLDVVLQKQISVIVDGLGDYLPASIKPCLLHGDLWSGNLAYLPSQRCLALFDPAPFYGDPESDIAMTKLFGQLPQAFYSQYREYFPAPKNESGLHSIYNLYHALNHFNLFGASYETMISDLISKTSLPSF